MKHARAAVTRRLSLMGALITGLAVVPLTLVSPPAHAAACPSGAWSYHQARAGGCGYGQWQRGTDRLGRAWFRLTGKVGDNRADGSCARVEVKTRVRWAPDSTQTYRICGNGKTTAIAFEDIDTASGLTGGVQAWSVRLCVGDSCTAYRDFRP